MYIKMTTDYLNYQHGSIYDVDSTTSANFIAAGRATAYAGSARSAPANIVLNSDGSSAGIKGPDGKLRSFVASALVSAYESQQRENQILGHYLEARAGLTAADTPTISALNTNPTVDLVDVAGQQISLFGSDLTLSTEMTVAQGNLGKLWLRGFSPGAFNWGQANSYRLSSSSSVYNVAGNQGLRPSDNYGYDGGITYTDIFLDSDVLYTRMLDGNAFSLWVNDNLISSTATLGLNVAYNAATLDFTSVAPGHGWVKIKFPSVAKRNIRIAVHAAGSIGDFYTRTVSTITPRSTAPIEWVHFGDSFSGYTGATSYTRALTEYLHTAFGRNINFINVAQGGTSFSNPASNTPGSAPVNSQKGNFYQQFITNWQYCAPQVITALIGHNDAGYLTGQVAPKMAEMLIAVRAKFPNALFIVFTSNASPGIITPGYDLRIEGIMLAAIASLGLDIITVPVQSSANPFGAFLRGSGYVGAPNGSGNTDIYTSSDGTHPTDTGHKAHGMWMPARMYEALQARMA